MAALSTVIAGAALGAGLYNAFKPQKKETVTPPVLPPAPQRDVLGETQAVTRARKRKMGSSRADSIKTGPSGAAGAAPTERSTLLGY